MAKNSSADKPGVGYRPYALRRFDETPQDKVLISKAEAPEASLKRRETEAAEKGYSVGFEKGLADAKEQIDTTVQHLMDLIRELDNFAERRGKQLLPDLVSLSIEIAEKVIHKELDLDREAVVAVATDALGKVSSVDEQVTILVNPIDFDSIEHRLSMLRESSGLKHIEVKPSESIHPGGCYVETVSGAVDARIEEQIKEVRNAVRTALDS